MWSNTRVNSAEIYECIQKHVHTNVERIFHRANVFRAIGVIAALEEDLGRAYGFMGFEVPEPAGTRRSL